MDVHITIVTGLAQKGSQSPRTIGFGLLDGGPSTRGKVCWRDCFDFFLDALIRSNWCRIRVNLEEGQGRGLTNTTAHKHRKTHREYNKFEKECNQLQEVANQLEKESN